MALGAWAGWCGFAMTSGAWIRVIFWSALVGGTIAVLTYLLLDWAGPGRVVVESASPPPIMVLIDGAVATPGPVELPVGSRLLDVINAAGGLTELADTTRLNLAARIGDGEHISIPAFVPPEPVAPGATPMASSGNLIDINSATVFELQQLPGIGPAIAQRIVDFREFYGPFTSIDQLAEVTGISTAMVEELRSLVTAGG